jgi:hypothetical protein
MAPRALDDFTGRTFGSLEVLKKLPRVKNCGSTQYLVLCHNCRTKKRVQRGSLLAIRPPHTGCKTCTKREVAKKDFLNKTFNGSTVTKLLGSDKHGKLKWEVRCKCNSLFKPNTQDLRKRIEGGKLLCDSCLRSKEDEAYFWENRYAVFTGNARKRKIKCKISLAQFVQLASKSCHYCGIEPESRHQKRQDKRRRHVDGFANSIDRLDSSLPYVFKNGVPACDLCNRIKSDDSVEDFLSRMMRIGSRHLQINGK